MPLRMADLAKAERTVTLEYDGESVTVVYRPARLTAMMRLRLMAGPTLNVADVETATPAEWVPALEEWYDETAGLLVAWDVLDEKGKALKPTAQLLADLPQDFVGAVLRAIFDDAQVNPRSGGDSPGTSPPKA